MYKDLRGLIPTKEIYKDAAQPALKQAGEALEKVVNAARIVLAPLVPQAQFHSSSVSCCA